MDASTIQLIETETLISELMRRFDVAVFSATRHRPEKEMQTVYHRYTGDAVTASGLCNRLVRHIEDSNERNYVDVDDVDRL